MPTMKQRLMGTAAIAVGMAGVFVASPAPASAGTSSALSCAYYTARSNTLINYSGDKKGLIELRYDPCSRSVWARLTTTYGPCRPGDDGCGFATVHRNSDGAEASCNIPAGGTSCYTAALYDANVTSYARGQFDAGPGTYYGQTSSY